MNYPALAFLFLNLHGGYMKTAYINVVLQEVPGEIAIALSFTGCPMQCDGCHSPELRNPELGEKFTVEEFINKLKSYNGLLSCALFVGGDWNEKCLIEYMDIALIHGLKVCLYTGKTEVSESIMQRLTYLKTGAWNKEVGGLNSPKTNQKMKNVKTGEDITSIFNRIISPSFKEIYV